jgi:hypothetical protein
MVRETGRGGWGYTGFAFPELALPENVTSEVSVVFYDVTRQEQVALGVSGTPTAAHTDGLTCCYAQIHKGQKATTELRFDANPHGVRQKLSPCDGLSCVTKHVHG